MIEHNHYFFATLLFLLLNHGWTHTSPIKKSFAQNYEISPRARIKLYQLHVETNRNLLEGIERPAYPYLFSAGDNGLSLAMTWNPQIADPHTWRPMANCLLTIKFHVPLE